MVDILMDDLSPRERYWLITGSVGPRPIALVTTLDSRGVCNAAPFSAFNYMAETPPLMIIGIDRYGEESHRITEQKDTLRNIVERQEFVVNMVDEPILERTILCATDFPKDVSEPEQAGFQTEASANVAVPRIVESPISWECRLFRSIELSEGRTLILGEIISMFFRDDLFDGERMRVRVDRFFPIGRLGGPNYCRTDDRLVLPVPPFDSKGKPLI
jgi:flavin reductase (DIM6/NTAB) family NADH-FMN oxidoreductase RutF